MKTETKKIETPLKKLIARQTARARALGCTAKTTAGIVRFLRANSGEYDGRLDTPHRSWGDNAQETARTADPDAKRARADKKFRRRWVADIRRQAEKLVLVPMGTLAEVSGAVDTISDRRAQLAEFFRRTAIAGVNLDYAIPPVPVGVLVDVDQHTARKAGVKLDMRGKDARIILTRGSSRLVSAPGETEWKNGRAVSYTRATRDNYVRSFAVIRDDQTVDYALHTLEMRIELPAELAWDAEKNGLRAYRTDSNRDDYHPDASDLFAGVARIVAKLEENRARRLVEEARLTAERADAEGVYICLADSLRAGNCQAASEAWMTRHGLEKNRHYAAVEILGLIGQDDPGRARLAISAAVHRHHREMERGYAELAEHVA
jgi:hypothetical protein